MRELKDCHVLVAEPLTGSEHSIEFLKENVAQVTVGAHSSKPHEGFTEEQLIQLGNENDAFIVLTREKLTRKVLENSKRLKLICKSGSGVDNIDVAAASELGILVTNAPVHGASVAEHAIALMLAVYKKIPQNERYIRKGGWRDDTSSGHDIGGKTIGLLGFGNIARQVAKRLQGWDAKLVAYDPYVTQEQADALGVEMLSLEDILRVSDILSFHMPLNDQTRHMISTPQFEMMKDGVVIVNTARGGVIEEAALVAALRSGKVAGAGLDNHEKEPLDLDDPLLTFDNVIVSPHIGGMSFEALQRIATQAAVNCVDALSGKRPQFVFNPAIYDKWHKDNFGD